MQQALTCDNLGDLKKGAARVTINDALAKMFDDLTERGHDREKRAVTIKLTAEKLPDGDVALSLSVGTKVPDYATGATICTIVEAGGRYKHAQLFFQEESPDNPYQNHLDDMKHPEAEAE